MSHHSSPPRVAVVVENAIQFYAPHYRRFAQDGRLDLNVLYLTDRGERPFKFGGTTVKHDASVLEGYNWKRLKNWSPFEDSHGVLDNFDPALYRELQTGGYSAVWFYGYAFASVWLGFAACFRAGIPVMLYGESENYFPRPRWLQLAKRRILGPLFQRIDAFLYIGESNRAFYKDFGVPDERLFRTPYGLDNAPFQQPETKRAQWRREIRDRLGLGPNTCVFIFTSKHRHPKRPADAVAGFCELPPELDAALIMLGDGDLRSDAERVFRERSRGHRVLFLGSDRPYSELPKYLAAADVFVMCSVETWGMAMSEALAAGLAIVTSDHAAGWPDMVAPGVNGFIYGVGLIPSLGAHMKTLAENPAMVASMKRASFERSQLFGVDRIVDGVVGAVAYVTSKPVTAAGVPRRASGIRQ